MFILAFILNFIPCLLGVGLEVNIEVWDTRKEVKDALSNYLTVNGLRHTSGPVLHQPNRYIHGGVLG